MNICLLSDTHGDYHYTIKQLQDIRKKVTGSIRIIQLGDFGFIGFNNDNDKKLKMLNNYLYVNDINIDFIDGNHEDFVRMKSEYGLDIHLPKKQTVLSNIDYIGRCTTELINNELVMYMGGAGSFDKANRIPGKDWFMDEVITDEDIDRVVKCDILISHDSPIGSILSNKHIDSTLHTDYTKYQYSKVFNKCKPSKVYHGHQHITYEERYVDYVNDCQVIGLNHVASKESSFLFI